MNNVRERFLGIEQKVEYLQSLDLPSHTAEIEELCKELQSATEELQLILTQMKQ